MEPMSRSGEVDSDMAVLARDLYVMLRDATPGPLTDDMPVTPLLRRARAALTDTGLLDENGLLGPE